MQLTTIRTETGTFVARRERDRLVILPFSSMTELLRQADWRDAAAVDGEEILAQEARLAQTLNPGKTMCVGLNYRSHIAETGRPTPTHPTLFAKYPESLTAPDAPIRLPAQSDQVDWEVELGVVIGKPAYQVSEAEAVAFIAGYTVVNDVSMRDWQARTTQWFQGKNFQSSTPVGPYLVTPEEIDHARDLRISCTVGGLVMQDGRTSDLLFDPAALVSYISQFITLMPGDLIATGTPGGIGNARNPQRFLSAGELLESEIEGIGRLTNLIATTA